MNTKTRGSFLAVSFLVRNNRWVLEQGWLGPGLTERERVRVFDDALYSNLAAQYASELADDSWVEFQGLVADAILPMFPAEDAISFEHLSGEFWGKIEIMFHASVACSLLETFSHPYSELRKSLMEGLRSAEVTEDDDPWKSTFHTLVLTKSLAVEVTIPSGPVALVFGHHQLPSDVTVRWSMTLPRVTRLEFVLDSELIDVDDADDAVW